MSQGSIRDHLMQTLQETQDELFSALYNKSLLCRRSKAIPDSTIFIDLHSKAVNLVCHEKKALAYLKSKNLSTYGDLRDMHGRIVGHVTNNDPAYMLELENKVSFGDEAPEFRGEFRQLLCIHDFFIALRHIPHSPVPEHPTILGLMLSASQLVLRDPRFFVTQATHHDIMHLFLLQGTVQSAAARTTAGTPLLQNYADYEAPETRPGNILFEDFNITNAIPFHPQSVLVTGHFKHTSPDEQVQFFYNVLKSGEAHYLPSPDGTFNHIGDHVQNTLSGSMTPDFLRSMWKIIK